MLFSSLTFLFGFLPILLLFYFLIKNRKIRNLILLLLSLIFYAWGEPKYILLMIAEIFIVYLFGLKIEKYEVKKCPKKRKLSFVISVALVVFILIYFKYTNFIILNINNIFNLKINLQDIILPIGISFYTFQILSYLIDLYKGKIKVQKNFFSLALYVSLFPQLIAGPIVRYETVEEEIDNRNENIDGIIIGTKRFIIGLSKKVIISNQMALFADTIFNNYSSNIGTTAIWVGALAYTFQIYFDFSGYSDMAIGLGRIFGFHFLENFNYPYMSTSITDFWRRWHISLSSWFKDYVYIPLGGNRVSKSKWIRNMLIVWSLTGLWHGASWNFVIWGIYYAIILIIEKLLLKNKMEKYPKFIRWLITFILVIIGWTIFRSNTIIDLLNYLKYMFIYRETNWIYLLSNYLSNFTFILFIIPAFILSFPIKFKIKNKSISIVLENITLLMLLLICIILLVSSSYNPFIYFRF